MGHPQANGETEDTNKTLLQGLKTHLDRVKGAWHEEPNHILWAYQTT